MIILLDTLSHTILISAEQTWTNLQFYTKGRNCGTLYLTQLHQITFT